MKKCPTNLKKSTTGCLSPKQTENNMMTSNVMSNVTVFCVMFGFYPTRCIVIHDAV